MPTAQSSLFWLPFRLANTTSGTVHPGSKPGHVHVTDVAQDPAARIARAAAWSKATGRPVPPHLRRREPLEPARPATSMARLVSYQAAYRSMVPLTPAQASRLRHKHGRREFEALTGIAPPPRAAAPRQPRTPAQRRRAARNAAQQARHAAKAAAA